MGSVIQGVAHRPWPMSAGPWVMAQSWHDLLFAHWPVNAAVMRPLLPPQLQVDTFEGSAWLAVVPFRMTGVRLRGTPALPWLSAFPELNVRTYVKCDGKPGVWFFSLAQATRCTSQDGWNHYDSERTHLGASSALLKCRYRPIGEVFSSRRGTLEYFLTERYCLYTTDGRGRIIRGEIHHPPWQLQRAEAELAHNSMAESLGVALVSRPLLYFARRQDVLVWAPRLRTAPRGRSSQG